MDKHKIFERVLLSEKERVSKLLSLGFQVEYNAGQLDQLESILDYFYNIVKSED